MPTYEYECEACGHRFERFQPMASEPVRTCPACKKRRVRRLIGAGAGFIFRGSGFYQTDYRSAEYKARAEQDSSAGKGEKSDPPAKGSSDATAAKSGKSEKGDAPSAPASGTKEKPAAPAPKTDGSAAPARSDGGARGAKARKKPRS